MKNNKIYCTFCGEENNIDDLTCKKCHRFLKRKDHPLIDYMEDKIKGDFEGDVKNTFFSILKNYIKSHLYGFVMTLSIFATAAAIVVNVVEDRSNEIHYIDEKITFEESNKYYGEGLTSLEVARKYIDAIKANDLKTVKGLQLDTFYPSIKEQIRNDSDSNFRDFPDTPAYSYHILEYRDIYLKSLEEIRDQEYYLGESELVAEHDTYMGYTTDNYSIRFRYCSNHTCKVENGFSYADFSAHIKIQLIEVEGNYYVFGERVGMYMGQNEEVYHMALFRAEGDTSNLSFEDALREYDSCNESKTCIFEHGFNHKNIIENLYTSTGLIDDSNK